ASQMLVSASSARVGRSARLPGGASSYTCTAPISDRELPDEPATRQDHVFEKALGARVVVPARKECTVQFRCGAEDSHVADRMG
ncbi:MAG: hypothetical protein ACRDQX_15480, partial [Pseudonocardiaceae bacterium]